MRAHFAFFNRFERDVTMNWYFAVLKNYVGFSGRPAAKNFGCLCCSMSLRHLCWFIDGLLGMSSPKTGLGPICGLYLLATFLPGLASNTPSARHKPERLVQSNRNYSLCGSYHCFGSVRHERDGRRQRLRRRPAGIGI